VVPPPVISDVCFGRPASLFTAVVASAFEWVIRSVTTGNVVATSTANPFNFAAVPCSRF
jgi:hypothetical protein